MNAFASLDTYLERPYLAVALEADAYEQWAEQHTTANIARQVADAIVAGIDFGGITDDEARRSTPGELRDAIARLLYSPERPVNVPGDRVSGCLEHRLAELAAAMNVIDPYDIAPEDPRIP